MCKTLLRFASSLEDHFRYGAIKWTSVKLLSKHTVNDQTEISAFLAQSLGVQPGVVHANVGFRSVHKDKPCTEIEYRCKDKRLTDEERRLLNRRHAIKPIIGHLKSDHLVYRCLPKGSKVDALLATFIRWMLRMIDDKGIGLLLCPLHATGLTILVEKLAEIFGRNRRQGLCQHCLLA